jgi:hypothetical protein
VANGPRPDFHENIIGFFGAAPAVLVFIHGSGEKALDFVQRLDAQAAKDKSLRVGVIFLAKKEAYENVSHRLKTRARQRKIEKAWLCVFKSLDGPSGYAIAKEAEITLVLYRYKTVAATFAFREGEFAAKVSEKILEELRKLSARQ